MALIAALLSVGLVSAPARADDAANCAVAESHAGMGDQIYGSAFDDAVRFLVSESISFTRYGRRTHNFADHDSRNPTIASCPQTYGGCGADKFDVKVSLDDSEYSQLPSVHFSVKEGAKDTELGYILIGKMDGLVYHDSCGNSSMYISGHTWFARVSRGEINGNIGDHAYVGTSLSQAGATIARGYTPQGIQAYEDETVLIRIEDFGTSARLERFMAITEPMQISGTTMKFR